jgi:hypothetical protein
LLNIDERTMRKYIAGDLAIPRDAGVGAVQRDRTRTLIRGPDIAARCLFSADKDATIEFFISL